MPTNDIVLPASTPATAAMPFFGTRRFDVHTKRTFMNDGSNRRGSNEELVVGELGQVGTQFDGFTHQTHEDSVYNCFKVDEIATRSGFTKMGIEKVGSLITRGVLIDVAAFKGVEMLPDTYKITPADLQQALERQKLTLQPGDAVLIYTGWSTLWAKDNARYVKTCPGIGLAAAAWLATQDPMLVGADNWPVEVGPNPDPQLSLPVHQFMLVVGSSAARPSAGLRWPWVHRRAESPREGEWGWGRASIEKCGPNPLQQRGRDAVIGDISRDDAESVPPPVGETFATAWKQNVVDITIGVTFP